MLQLNGTLFFDLVTMLQLNGTLFFDIVTMLQLNMTLFFDLVTCFKFLKVLKFQSHASQPVIYAAIKSWLKQNFPNMFRILLERHSSEESTIANCVQKVFIPCFTQTPIVF